MTTATKTKTETEIIREFLRLPREMLPSATWANRDCDDQGSCWPWLRSAISTDGQLNHVGDRILLHADCDGWRDGVVVSAG
jgi:hypothetical protein